MAVDDHLTEVQEADLYRYYGLGQATTVASMSDPSTEGVASTRGPDETMTRSEEELEVSTRSREAGRVRLRKWVEDEHVVAETFRKERVALDTDIDPSEPELRR